MQTFLPYPDYTQSAHVLDYRRLGAQINEVQILLGALHETNNGGYRNHSVTNMWRGHELALCEFGLTCLDEWHSRDYKHRESNEKALQWHLELAGAGGDLERPPWFGERWVHTQYQGLLVWKDPGYYTRFFPGVRAVSNKEFIYPKNDG